MTWKNAKGKKATNQKEACVFYSQLWDKYIQENPELLILLKQACGLSDIFGQPNHCCQATELWRIRNEKKQNKFVQRKKLICVSFLLLTFGINPA